MKRSRRILLALSAAFVLLSVGSCRIAGERRMPEDVLYLNLLWHQHQPLYYQDPETGIYSRPWVRVHSTKSYYDMAAILREYPEVRVTFNLTPVLLRQIDDYVNGAKDRYWVIAEKDPSELTNEEKRFILERFFDANHETMIGRFPRYVELLERKDSIDTRTIEGIAAFSDQDYLDLQVFFNLVWFDPMFLEEEPLASLVEKAGGYTQEDKEVLFAEVERVIREVVPIHRELQDDGRIEVITTPYAHPILPLVFSTSLAAVGDPTAELPDEFYYPNDAVAHLERSVEVYRSHFGRDPVGLWPAEGAVAQEIVKMVGDAGYRWMASGEPVLARSIGMDGFVRDATDTVTNADALYRPYVVEPGRGEPVAIVFRDLRLSDLIGFEYSGTPAEAAAADFMRRLENIRSRLLEETGGEGGPHLVSVILDGENAWEHYPNDGKEFLHALYRELSESETVRTTTVTEFMEAFPDQRRIDDLWPGAWFSSDYSTWIGEREETKAWNLLGRVRSFLAAYDMRNRRETTPERLAEAQDYMYLAEGSDWFWWYGNDQDSGQDEYFDEAYRELLANVFRALDEPVPDYLRVPIIPERPEPPSRSPGGIVTPRVDGVLSPQEWASAGYYRNSGSAQARGADVLDELRYGFDREHLFVAMTTAVATDEALGRGAIHLYLGYPGQVGATPFVDSDVSTLVGFDAGVYLELTAERVSVVRLTADGRWESGDERVTAGAGDRTIELSIPLSVFGDVESGDEISFRAFTVERGEVLDRLPASGPGRGNVPDLGRGVLVLSVQDPVGDDYGPGTYTYPTDAVFAPGSFDITEFMVEDEEEYVKFTVRLNAPIQNPWGSATNLSLQTIDIYVDRDPGAGTGSRLLLEGRNAALPAEHGWEYALWVEGWNQKVLTPRDPQDPASPPIELSGAPLKVRVDAEAGTVVIRAPKEIVGASPADYGYTLVVLSQEGYPSSGVRRVRDVGPTSAQWELGGAPDDVNHTRILDMAVPAASPRTQAELLSQYQSVSGGRVDALGPDDFPTAYLNTVE
ncbi:MAG: glucodextranase DOMON-like domain-containing protein [Spirochaetota bacterium]